MDEKPHIHTEAACVLECHDDPERFRERVGKLVRHKPVEKPE